MHAKCVWLQLLRSDTLMRIASTVSWRYGWAGGPSCQLEMRLVWSLDRKVETAMKVLKSPTIVSGFKKHTRRKFQDVNADQDIHQLQELPAKSIGLLPSCGLCLSSVAATKRIVRAHLRTPKYVQMPTLFRASKLLPFALHFACKVRYVRHVRSYVVRRKF